MNTLSFLKTHIYKMITAAGFIGAALLVVLTPLQLPDPDDWANKVGVENFSQGKLTVDSYTVYKQMGEVGKEGGFLIQYLPVAKNKWALEKAPGYVFYLVPFYKAGIPRWGNVGLLLGAVIVTYVLLKRMRDEKASMIGSLLMMFTPITLVMLNRIYMDTMASLAFLVMGGGLYLYYHLEKDRVKPLKGGILLFLAFLFTGWSVISRYTNAPIAAVLALHYVLVRIVDWRKGHGTGMVKEIAPLIFGVGIPVAAILLYNDYVFGGPLKNSYSISPYPIKFAFQYLGQADANGSIPEQILRYNTQGFARNLWIGMPLFFLAIPAFISAVVFKFVSAFRHESGGTWTSLQTELPWDVLLVLIGWFVCVFGLYWGYEWTAGLKIGGGAVVFDRFLLPGLFPVVIVTALVLARFPWWAYGILLAALIAFSVMFYLQWDYSKLNILPAWVTERRLETHWPGYIFPPWVDWDPNYYRSWMGY